MMMNVVAVVVAVADDNDYDDVVNMDVVLMYYVVE
jgi:hypothetical protein